MAANIDALADWLSGFLGDDDQVEEFNNNAEGVLTQAGFGDVNAVDVQQAMNRLTEANQGNQSFTSQGGFANFGGSGVVNLAPPPAYSAYESSSDGGGISGAIESINHYASVVNVTNQSYEDNDTTTINDQDTNIDNSVNQDITAFGDVTQDFDNDVVTGDRAVAAGDDAQVNTGDGAVQVGGNVTDATIATGDVGGSVTGDVSDSVVGDNNQVVDVDGYGADVGPVAFGDGDAIEAENVNQGSGAIVDDVSGDVAVNTGYGDQAVVQDSTVDDSSIGGGDVHADDVNITATDDSAVAFGDGSSAEATETNVQNYDGTVQVAGDDSIQQGVTDNSFNQVNDYDDGGYQPPVILDEAPAPEPAYEAPDHDPGAPTIDDGDTINQSVDTVDDGIDA